MLPRFALSLYPVNQGLDIGRGKHYTLIITLIQEFQHTFPIDFISQKQMFLGLLFLDKLDKFI